MLTRREKIELLYLYELGFRYIARNKCGSVRAFKEMPVRDKIANGSNHSGYDTWVIGSYPVKDHSKYFDLSLGSYDFILWESEPMAIDKLIEERGML